METLNIMSIIIVLLTVGGLFWFYKKRHIIWQDSSSFNNIALGLCAMLTLSWGAYTFDALNQRDKAAAELKELQERIKGTESTFFSIDVTIKKWDKGFYILPVITVKNSGTQPIHIKMDRESITIKKINVKEDKVKAVTVFHPNFYDEISSDAKIDHTPMYDVIVPISAERKINYAVNVNEPGLYYITFRAKTISENGTVEDKKVNKLPVIWFASKYFFVE
ncbi:hypothetical protein QMZ93_15940 [Pantoea stewartii subsp. indologenes]|uniref:hypothetical protein n=1 Tax=Pantoea stewartii TaxID=66269 RepID=UPI00197E25D5|nr:hypothetical protein [Pantoea stewartii]MDK2634823.1 hypothetical protein [Pantoea stewartii subsp. indologenes]